ncbi:MAG: DUF1616 domain-containing protein [Dehalococcoidia bacterium]|nr:DUF1616 domain-containing protein [Dehalococcoidia bacterium]
MKREVQHDILAVLIATALLIMIVVLIPSNVAGVVLGLPFLLFFPGYVLVAALFPRRTDLDGLKRVALSFLMSIAVIALIGLVLNYTSWGIALYPITICVSSFILIASVAAWYRRTAYLPAERFRVEVHFRMPAFLKTRSSLDVVLTTVLVLALLGTTGILLYSVARPKVAERFTEFYVMGTNGQADRYPTLFTYDGSQVTSVTYREGETDIVVNEPYARVRLAIVNREHRDETYTVEVLCDGEPLPLRVGGAMAQELGPIVLHHEEEWELEIGFSPLRLGDAQKIEFVLYMNGDLYFEEGQAPHLWVDARASA